MSSIFQIPGLTNDVEREILTHCDVHSLVSLSCMHQYAHRVIVIENNSAFKERFLHLYRSVHPSPEKLFPHFQKYFPERCWQLCCFLYSDKKEDIFIFRDRFFKMVPIVQVLDIEKTITTCEGELKTICGTGYEDPDSPIHKAWEAYETLNNSNTKL